VGLVAAAVVRLKRTLHGRSGPGSGARPPARICRKAESSMIKSCTAAVNTRLYQKQLCRWHPGRLARQEACATLFSLPHSNGLRRGRLSSVFPQSFPQLWKNMWKITLPTGLTSRQGRNYGLLRGWRSSEPPENGGFRGERCPKSSPAQLPGGAKAA
jgi:hypothetical protein